MKPIVLGASVQGASHIRSEVECQDSYKKQVCDNGTTIMAVADGHGSKSCPFSKTGSQTAVNVFCDKMSEYLKNYSDSPELLLTYLNREGDTKVAQEIDSEWKRRILKTHKKNKRDIQCNDNGEPNKSLIYAQYGTTLLGLVLANDFLFAFQIGDGDILFVSADEVEPVIKGDKILGVETHSLSKEDAWKKAITIVRRMNFEEKLPSMFLISSDGFANSYKNEEEFIKTCADYLDMINQHGIKAINENLKTWLSETSAMGCGDDITVLMAYLYSSQNVQPDTSDECASENEDEPSENESDCEGNNEQKCEANSDD